MCIVATDPIAIYLYFIRFLHISVSHTIKSLVAAKSNQLHVQPDLIAEKLVV